ncbi:MAG: winged helix-turn-helix domain-containing protein [Methanolobus sp.]|nr:winged helix-turn-helix domain-containing protein [Methanolobus sp.]
MVKKYLLDLMFASEKRKSVLTLLKDGPQNTTTLLEALETTRQALLPQLKMLEDRHLIIHYDDVYELTTIGRLVVDEIVPLLGTVDVLDKDMDYWGTRELDFIPIELLKRLRELDSCNFLEPSMSEFYTINNEFHEKTKESKSITSVTTFLYPDFPALFSEYVESGVDITLVFSPELAEKVRTDCRDEFKKLLQSGQVHVFVSQIEMPFLSATQNDHCIFLRFLKKGLAFDSKQMMCCSPSSVEWGRDFCKYYLRNSEPMTDI